MASGYPLSLARTATTGPPTPHTLAVCPFPAWHLTPPAAQKAPRRKDTVVTQGELPQPGQVGDTIQGLYSIIIGLQDLGSREGREVEAGQLAAWDWGKHVGRLG